MGYPTYLVLSSDHGNYSGCSRLAERKRNSDENRVRDRRFLDTPLLALMWPLYLDGSPLAELDQPTPRPILQALLQPARELEKAAARIAALRREDERLRTQPE
ncbi:MAG: hypothetical protein GQ526_12805 [Ardenticatenales bacterium]|nr:hypothetical protein [Ardenticatenales bacterium]